MNNWQSYKTKQFFFVLIKLSIVVVAFYFIYQKLANNPDLEFSAFISLLTKNNIFSLKIIVFLLFLSFFNWFLEIVKWQNLVFPIKKITLKNAIEQTLGALTASLFTPNRIGEYGAKAMYYKPNYRKRILLLNLFNNLLQMAVTTCFGVIGFYLFISKYNIKVNHFKTSKTVLIVVVILILVGFLITKSKINIKGFSFKKIKQFIIEFPKRNSFKAVILSVLRYLLFSFQFYYLLLVFNVDISYFDAMVIITSMYLLSSVIPSIFIFDVLIKGSIALYLFSFLGISELTILSIVTSMWILNFVIPSLLGSFYVLNFKVSKHTN